MEQQLFELGGDGNKVLRADKTFWEDAEAVIFHSELLEIRYKNGQTERYLHDWFYQVVESSEQKNTERQKEELYTSLGCRYRFEEGTDLFMDYLYQEAVQRGIQRYPLEAE